MGIKVYNREGKSLWDEYIFSMSDTRSWTSSTYSTMSDLDSYWRIQRSTKLTDLQKDLTREGMNKIEDLLNTAFGFKKIKDKIKFAAIGKKNHPDYDKFQRNAEIMQAAFELMSADKSLDAVKAKAQPALDFYSAAAIKYSVGNKDQQKLKHICLYNQALAYCWLEDFEQAETIAKSILKFDSKKQGCKKIVGGYRITRSSLAMRTSLRHQVVVGGKSWNKGKAKGALLCKQNKSNCVSASLRDYFSGYFSIKINADECPAIKVRLLFYTLIIRTIVALSLNGSLTSGHLGCGDPESPIIPLIV